MKTIICIPARMASKRFPGKPLALIHGKPLIQWVWENACRSKADETYIVSSCPEIIAWAKEVGANWISPKGNFRNGTERIAEASKQNLLLNRTWIPDEISIMNLQCDEPDVTSSDLNKFIDEYQNRGHKLRSTCVTKYHDVRMKNNDDMVKAAVCDGYVSYFSRAPMAGGMLHIGIYLMDPWYLYEYSDRRPSFLEEAELLEQLRIMGSWYATEITHPVRSVNNQWDCLKFDEKPPLTSGDTETSD